MDNEEEGFAMKPEGGRGGGASDPSFILKVKCPNLI